MRLFKEMRVNKIANKMDTGICIVHGIVQEWEAMASERDWVCGLSGAFQTQPDGGECPDHNKC